MRSAQSALDAGSWNLAQTTFRALADESSNPLAYEGLAQASWWLDDGDICVQARESAYRGHQKIGDSRGAARNATALAYDSLLFGHGESVARAWLQRAAAILASIDESAEHGWHAVREAELAIATGSDPQRAVAAAQRASGVAGRLGIEDLAVVSSALQGLAMTHAAQFVAGMLLLDASVVAAIAGDVSDPMWIGKVCCWQIVACNANNDVTRAAEGVGGWRQSVYSVSWCRCSMCVAFSTRQCKSPAARGTMQIAN